MQVTRAPSSHRCGQSHQKAKLTDKQVIAMRKRHIAGIVGYETLARELDCGVSTARDIAHIGLGLMRGKIGDSCAINKAQ